MNGIFASFSQPLGSAVLVAGILWTAYDVAADAPEPPTNAPSGMAATQPTDATGGAFDARDLAVLANAGG